MKLELVPTAAEILDYPAGEAAAVVFDVLRATSTIATALAHGCRAVVPVLTEEEAHSFRRDFAGGGIVLGGEKNISSLNASILAAISCLLSLAKLPPVMIKYVLHT